MLALEEAIRSVPEIHAAPVVDFSGISIDEVVEYEDGDYRVGDKIYSVRDGRLSSIWSVPDENQLTFF
jgi:hypothetical protein